jgi:hypothetical protein
MTDGTNCREDLHAALDALLDAADADVGRLESDAFWAFAAMLASGRGIAVGLHEDGLEAVRATPDSPLNTRNERQTRAYHIALTAALLARVGRLPGQGSILPANYQHGVVIQDLLWMLGGNAGTGEADPQLLTSGRGGIGGLRRAARRRLVGVVRWRMGATGKTRAQVWDDLMGDRDERNGDQDADPTKLDRWQSEFGGVDGWLCRTAFEAGAARQDTRGWSATNEELADVIALARASSGRRTRTAKKTAKSH